MKKRILFVSEYYHRGGLERTLIDLIGGLDPVRFEVSLLVKAPGLGRHLRAALPPHVRITESHLFTVLPWQERLAQFSGPSFLEFPARLALRILADLSFLIDILVLRSYIERLKPDVLQIVNGGYPGGMICLAAAVAGRMAAVPFVDVYVLSYPRPRRIGLIDRMTDLWVGASVHSLTANSEAARRGLSQLRGMPPEKLQTIYSALPEEPAPATGPVLAKEWRRESDEILIGLLSVFLPVKGHRFLLEAAAMLAPRYPKVRWILAGDGPTRPSMIELSRRLGLSDEQVLFPGWFDPGHSHEVAEGLDIVVHPSLQESFPYAILEAMRAGKPVIATRIAGIPEQIEDGVTGLLVEPADPGALAKAMEHLLTKPAWAATLGQAARRRFRERLGIGVMREAFISRYERAPSRNPNAG